MAKWQIQYYQNKSQTSSPVFDFIEALPLKAQAKVYNTLELLECFGINLGSPHVKKGTNIPLYEVRIVGSNSIRIFYITHNQRAFLLHGLAKKTNKSPKQELKTALRRLKDL